jgi:hypothetical protein
LKTRSPEEALKDFYEHKWPRFVENQINPVDRAHLGDPLRVAEFSTTIFQFMKQAEELSSPQFGYMELQQDVTERMRAILVDWLIEVHYKFKLLPETLFLTVNLVDRFLGL